MTVFDIQWLHSMRSLHQGMREDELSQELQKAEIEFNRLAAELESRKEQVKWNETKTEYVEALIQGIAEAKTVGTITDFIDAVGGITPDDTSAAFKEIRKKTIGSHGAIFFALADAEAILERELQAEAKVWLPQSILPSNCVSRTDEAKVKQHGEIWIIKKGDPDPNPSSPHAHNYEAGHKLDLKNGDLYRSGTKKYIGEWIVKKELLLLREKFEKFGVSMPPLDLQSSKRNSPQ